MKWNKNEINKNEIKIWNKNKIEIKIKLKYLKFK